MAVSVVVEYIDQRFVIDAADSASPAQRYSQWAQAIGVSETETLQALDTDDGAFAVTLGASPYENGSTTAMFSSEGGFAPYRQAPDNTTSIGYSLTTVGRMFGFTSRPDALMTFHPEVDCRSLGVLFQRKAAVSIFTGRIRQFQGETYRLDFALRVDASGWELVVQPLDQLLRVKLIMGKLAMVELFSADVAVGLSRSYTFTPTTIAAAPISTAVQSLATIASDGAMPPYGGTRLVAPLRGRNDHLSGVLGKGMGRVRGTVADEGKPNDSPVSELVRLHRRADGLVVREMWSDRATGEFLFDYIDELQSYYVLSFDHDGNFLAVIADSLTLASGGVELMP